MSSNEELIIADDVGPVHILGESFLVTGKLREKLVALADEMRGLRERLAEANSAHESAYQVINEYGQRIVAAQKREQQLREALPKYCSHLATCAVHIRYPAACDCGLAALAASPAPVESKRIHDLEDMNFELSKAWREAMVDARRYRRLRVLGAAPSTWQASVPGTVLRFTNLDEFVDDDIRAHASRGEAEPDYAPPHLPRPDLYVPQRGQPDQGQFAAACEAANTVFGEGGKFGGGGEHG